MARATGDAGDPVPDKKPILMLGLPKGSLEESTRSLFAKAGWKITTNSRSYRPTIDDPELDGRFVQAQEVSRYVEHGFFDCGLTGLDWIQENGSDVVEVCDLVYSRASAAKSRWVLCVAEDSPVRTAKDLAGKRVATELVQTVTRYFASRKIPVSVEFSWGATEVKVPDLVDAIVDITETEVVAACEQAQDRRHAPRDQHQADRQPEGMGQSREAQENRGDRAPRARRARGGIQGRPQDERPEKGRRRDHRGGPLAARPDHIAAQQQELGRP